MARFFALPLENVLQRLRVKSRLQCTVCATFYLPKLKVRRTSVRLDHSLNIVCIINKLYKPLSGRDGENLLIDSIEPE
jgi:hypothetical protein